LAGGPPSDKWGGLPLILPDAASAELPATPHHSYDALFLCATRTSCGVYPDERVQGRFIASSVLGRYPRETVCFLDRCVAAMRENGLLKSEG
jgi:hypothetical protein